MYKKIALAIVLVFTLSSIADASKCRVWYRADGHISVTTYVSPRNKPGDMTMDEWFVHQCDLIPMNIPQFAGLDFEDMDTSQLPQDRADRDRWRGSKATGIQIDRSLVLRKDLLQEIDDELARGMPNMAKVSRLRRRIDKKEHD